MKDYTTIHELPAVGVQYNDEGLWAGFWWSPTWVLYTIPEDAPQEILRMVAAMRLMPYVEYGADANPLGVKYSDNYMVFYPSVFPLQFLHRKPKHTKRRQRREKQRRQARRY